MSTDGRFFVYVDWTTVRYDRASKAAKHRFKDTNQRKFVSNIWNDPEYRIRQSEATRKGKEIVMRNRDV